MSTTATEEENHLQEKQDLLQQISELKKKVDKYRRSRKKAKDKLLQNELELKKLKSNPPLTPTIVPEPSSPSSPRVDVTPPISPATHKKVEEVTQLASLSDSDSTELDDALREFARAGNVEEMSKLMTMGVGFNTKDETGYTALHWSAIAGQAKCLAQLIRAGAEVNQVDHGGWTALHYAAYKGHRDCLLHLLCSPNIDVDLKNSTKKTAVQLCTNKGLSVILKDFKQTNTKLLIDHARKFWMEGSKVDGSTNMPQEIQKKEQELRSKEKLLLEKEQGVKRLEGELQLMEQTIKRKQKEEIDKKDEMEKKAGNLKALEADVRKQIEQHGEDDLSNSILTVAPEEFETLSELGQGGFGTVYKANWRGDLVAVKKLKCKEDDTELLQAFQRETKVLAKLRHPNILMILGACCRAPDLVLVTELMVGDLTSVLTSKEKLDWDQSLKMMIDIARGMNYLHNLRPSMVHRDLKSKNLLVDDTLKIKISDFGTAVSKESMGTQVVGTAAYMSPERLRGEESDEKTDVFSYGVVLWEFLTRKCPWESLSNIQIVARVGHADERLSFPEPVPKKTPQGLIGLIKDCWEGYSTKRPSFELLLSQLREIQEQSTTRQRSLTKNLTLGL